MQKFKTEDNREAHVGTFSVVIHLLYRNMMELQKNGRYYELTTIKNDIPNIFISSFDS